MRGVEGSGKEMELRAEQRPAGPRFHEGPHNRRYVHRNFTEGNTICD